MQLLLILQNGGRMTAREIAAKLEVSERTVLRDIEALSGSGVPVYAIRGARGGFELLDTFEQDVPALPAGLTTSRGRLRRVRVRLSPTALQRALVLGRPDGWRERRHARLPADRSHWLEGSFRFESYDAAVGELLALGVEVEVLLPEAFRATMADAGRQIAHRHESAVD